jgi:hypothetical protein
VDLDPDWDERVWRVVEVGRGFWIAGSLGACVLLRDAYEHHRAGRWLATAVILAA